MQRVRQRRPPTPTSGSCQRRMRSASRSWATCRPPSYDDFYAAHMARLALEAKSRAARGARRHLRELEPRRQAPRRGRVNDSFASSREQPCTRSAWRRGRRLGDRGAVVGQEASGGVGVIEFTIVADPSAREETSTAWIREEIPFASLDSEAHGGDVEGRRPKRTGNLARLPTEGATRAHRGRVPGQHGLRARYVNEGTRHHHVPDAHTRSTARNHRFMRWVAPGGHYARVVKGMRPAHHRAEHPPEQRVHPRALPPTGRASPRGSRCDHRSSASSCFQRSWW